MIIRKTNSVSRFFAKYCTSSGAKDYFICSPIFYVNAPPHIGHLYTSIICDAAKRFSQLMHGRKNVFSIGTDEHGIKIQQAALKAKLPIEDYCTGISKKYETMFKDFNVDYSAFVRTTDSRHKNAVEKFWTILKDNGHIYSANYSGWYCIPDETFLTETQVGEAPGKPGTKISLESGHPVEWSQEQNYMFRLSNFQNDLTYWLKDENTIKPKKYHKMVCDWINNFEVLGDLSISRPASRVHWGIPVPGDPMQSIYVWLDALVSYLTAAGFPDTTGMQFKSCWPPDLHVVGKDILKFHAIYWPAFLMASGLDPPRSILCHSHWMIDGEKMSKSKNNVICPNACIDQYTTEGLRYFLLREGVAHSDGNYSDKKIKYILNSELADTLGNLLSRCCGAILNPKQVFPKLHQSEFDKLIKNDDITKKLTESLKELPDIAKDHYYNHNYYKVVDKTIATLHIGNAFFETHKPWELRKANKQEELDVILHLAMESLRVCGIILWPIIPILSQRLLNKLNVNTTNIVWDDILPMSWDKIEKSERPLSNDTSVIYKRIMTKKS